MKGHVCDSVDDFPLERFHQRGNKKGRKVLIIGESPAPSGWGFLDKACYRSDGTILPTGKRLNELLSQFGLSVDVCGFTELSKCYVSKRSELESCSAKSLPILLKQIKNTQYKLIVVLGVGTTNILSRIMGTLFVVGEIQTIKLGRREYSLLPLFHPSPRNPHGQAKNKEILKKTKKKILKLIK